MCIAGTLLLRWAYVRLDHLHKHFHKKLHAWAMSPYQIIRMLGSNAYVLDLPFGISPIFNVDDLTLHRGTFESPCLPLGASAGTIALKFPHFPHPHTDNGWLDDKLAAPSNGSLWRLFCAWSSRPWFDGHVFPFSVNEFRTWDLALLVSSRQLAGVEFFSGGGERCSITENKILGIWELSFNSRISFHYLF